MERKKIGIIVLGVVQARLIARKPFLISKSIPNGWS